MTAAPTPALFETMRAEAGEIARLDLHLSRLAASAFAFGVPFERTEALRELARRVGQGRQRVRLTLRPDGTLDVDISPMANEPFRTAWICPDPMSEAGTMLCRHKTTAREHYEWRWRAAQARGADEAIVLNTAGEIMEGTRTSVWVEQEGRFWTPPLSSGGLPGVEREHLLTTHSVMGERVLRPDDLDLADAVYLSNALRGLMPVELVTADRRHPEASSSE